MTNRDFKKMMEGAGGVYCNDGNIFVKENGEVISKDRLGNTYDEPEWATKHEDGRITITRGGKVVFEGNHDDGIPKDSVKDYLNNDYQENKEMRRTVLKHLMPKPPQRLENLSIPKKPSEAEIQAVLAKRVSESDQKELRDKELQYQKGLKIVIAKIVELNKKLKDYVDVVLHCHSLPDLERLVKEIEEQNYFVSVEKNRLPQFQMNTVIRISLFEMDQYQFEYKAMDGSGKSSEGVINAKNEAEAQSKLKAQGLFPISLNQVRRVPDIFQEEKELRAYHRLGNPWERIQTFFKEVKDGWNK